MTNEEEHEKHLQDVLANWAKVLNSLPRTVTLEDRVAKLEARYNNDNLHQIEIMKRISSLDNDMANLKDNVLYSLNPPTKKACSEEMVYSVLNNLRDVLRRVDNARHTHTSITLEDVTKLVYILEDYKRL